MTILIIGAAILAGLILGATIATWQAAIRMGDPTEEIL
jgi:flagellar biosynthesis protein FliQ